MRCGGKLLIIDGGFSKAYQGKTGIPQLYADCQFSRYAVGCP